jgi:hypothetical protein
MAQDAEDERGKWAAFQRAELQPLQTAAASRCRAGCPSVCAMRDSPLNIRPLSFLNQDELFLCFPDVYIYMGQGAVGQPERPAKKSPSVAAHVYDFTTTFRTLLHCRFRSDGRLLRWRVKAPLSPRLSLDVSSKSPLLKRGDKAESDGQNSTLWCL